MQPKAPEPDQPYSRASASEAGADEDELGEEAGVLGPGSRAEALRRAEKLDGHHSPWSEQGQRLVVAECHCCRRHLLPL